MDEGNETMSPTRVDEPDTKSKRKHASSGGRVSRSSRAVDEMQTPTRPSPTPGDDGNKDATEEEEIAPHESKRSASRAPSQSQNGPGSSRRSAQVGSVYSGNKIRHLKKEDGIPLWRKDIQYDFLRAVFEDRTAVFTNVKDSSTRHTFADIYIDAMAQSSKTSRILKDKLLSDRAAAVNMAMVCLLVNVGRMNTTLNFFPEMRAQLRTYHSIPSLQAHQDPTAYKQLQDAPRLKSILKGASEDNDEPSTIDKLKSHSVPRTNPVNLIFILSQYAPKISELHFFPPRDFYDLVMRSTLSSRSRAKAFLWLMWWYLESDFTKDAAESNPFGSGVAGEGAGGMPIKVPPFEHLTEEQANLENVDTDEELAYGEAKMAERKRIIESDNAATAPAPKRGKKGMASMAPSDDGAGSPSRDTLSPFPSGSLRSSTRHRGPAKYSNFDTYHSDTDRTRSASPPTHLHTTFDSRPSGPGMRINTLLNEDSTPSGPSRSSRTRNTRDRSSGGPQRIIFKTKGEHMSEISPAPPGHGNHPILHPNDGGGGGSGSARRPRPLTAHQLAVESHRRARVDYILDRRLRDVYKTKRKDRLEEGSIFRAWLRCETLGDDMDSDEDAPHGHFIGLLRTPGEEDDFGEEVAAYSSAVRRSGRRLQRWDAGLRPGDEAEEIPPSLKRKHRHTEPEKDDLPAPSPAAGGERAEKKSRKSTKSSSGSKSKKKKAGRHRASPGTRASAAAAKRKAKAGADADAEADVEPEADVDADPEPEPEPGLDNDMEVELEAEPASAAAEAEDEIENENENENEIENENDGVANDHELDELDRELLGEADGYEDDETELDEGADVDEDETVDHGEGGDADGDGDGDGEADGDGDADADEMDIDVDVDE
ncbi:MAG: hypothetical protein M1819_006305 [Sarea resinae]|nr:MAG: hypothetical protein M1819_006305 [Sarea resinae]